MIKIRNLTPGILHIPAAKLRLAETRRRAGA